MSAASVTLKIGIASVLVPAAGALVGALLWALIPGCKCDEGVGCSGCGPLSSLIAFLVFGGFIGALAMLLSVLPASLLLAAILAMVQSSKPQPPLPEQSHEPAASGGLTPSDDSH